MVRNVLILGAAGRDFHNFNVFYRNNPAYKVAGFTATQIPFISERKYPKELSGLLYPKGIPIFEEKDLEKLIKKYNIDDVAFSYSDVSHDYVMHLASRAQSAGASFVLLGPNDTMIKSKKKVLAICATRTGAGKSPLTRKVTQILKKNVKYAVVRHPMPYGDLKKQIAQRFATLDDLDKHECTVEEREEYESHIKNGSVVYAGVDYEKILDFAEWESDLVLWDGGNNDFPFYKPDLLIVVADALRAGHEENYYPGETNFRMADVIVINKVSGSKKGASLIKENAKKMNPKAKIIETDVVLTSDSDVKLKGKKVIAVDDGPTITHGGMAYGAGYVFAKKKKAKLLDPRKHASGTIKKAYEKYPHMLKVLPALGYSEKQLKELEKTINRAKPDVVVTGTPIDIKSIIKIKAPVVHVKYDIKERKGSLEKLLSGFLRKKLKK